MRSKCSMVNVTPYDGAAHETPCPNDAALTSDRDAEYRVCLECFEKLRAENDDDIIREFVHELNGCNHKFIDSRACLKCGWEPPRKGRPHAE